MTLRDVQRAFPPRAKRKDSIGAHLLEWLASAFATQVIVWGRSRAGSHQIPPLRADHYPVAWECRSAVEAAAAGRKLALGLNDRPPGGIGAGYVDAVTTDDFSGGAYAAELRKARTGRTAGFAILGDPPVDARACNASRAFAPTPPALGRPAPIRGSAKAAATAPQRFWREIPREFSPATTASPKR